jgi:hypothetical protein
MTDDFTARYGDLLTGSYDCVDRIVLNAYFTLGHNPGGFRVWWRRWHEDSDAELDNAHLMRMAGRFARRVKAWAGANGVPLIYCTTGQRKHLIAEQYLATHTVGTGVFMVLAAKAPASVWEVSRTAAGVIRNLAKKRTFVNHYSFHIMDPEWGHVTIKMSGHPPFGTQVILNGHEYAAARMRAAGVDFGKEGNCFTAVADPQFLARVAETFSQHASAGRLGQVCDRWIYSACLCFGLDLAEQQRSGFQYTYSVYQLEYSRNLLFRVGGQMETLFDRVIDRTRTRLDIPMLRTVFGTKDRPHRDRSGRSPTQEIVIETPRYGLTYFTALFGLLQVKAYTKGEHVLRFEATVHNTKALGIGRLLERFPAILARLGEITDRFATVLDCVDTAFVPEPGFLDHLPAPTVLGRTRTGGIDVNSPRIHAVLAAVTALAPAPGGFTTADLVAKVHTMTGNTGYTTRQGAYDLRKLRGKELIDKPGHARRYQVTPQAAGTITALLTLRDQVIGPILAGVRSPRLGRKPAAWTQIDRDYETLRIGMQTLLHHLGLPPAAA